MFSPNLTGIIRTKTGSDVHGRPVLGPERRCPFAIVNLEVRSQKTSVRADSSASRGAADEIASARLKILMPAFISVKIGDIFSFGEETYEIVSTFSRRSVTGEIDHVECGLKVLP